MKPSCEFFEDYQFSKYLLLRYMNSPRVVEQVSTMMYDCLIKYLKNNIVNHESKYLLCYRKHVRHYSDYSNTILEGCNKGLKYHSSPVTPSMRIDNSFVVMANDCDIKMPD